MSKHPLLLDINRPEFYSAIEVVVSDLAWRGLQQAAKETPGRVAALGGDLAAAFASGHQLVFELAADSGSDFLDGHGYPVREGGGTILQAAAAGQLQELLGLNLEPRHGARALDSLRGVRPEKSKVRPAAPALWPAVFLQGMRGVLRKKGPPNYFEILSTLYEWGGAGEATKPHAGVRRILGAVLRPPASDPSSDLADRLAAAIIKWSETAGTPYRVLSQLSELRRLLEEWAGTNESSEGLASANVPVPFLELPGTPYRWMRQTIDRLCTAEWRSAVPAARWADWLLAVIRTGIGLGFLFEARYYLRLGQALLRTGVESPEAWNAFCHNLSQPLLSWTPRSAPPAERDVARQVGAWCAAGEAVRIRLDQLLPAEGTSPSPALVDAPHWLGHLARTLDACQTSRAHWQAALKVCIETAPSKTRTEETVRAALVCRERFTASPDLYSMLMPRARGRSLVVEPAEEWITVVASLCNPAGPGHSTTLSEVRKSLAMMGVEASRAVAVEELERAGLAETAHDSDDALVVTPAF